MAACVARVKLSTTMSSASTVERAARSARTSAILVKQRSITATLARTTSRSTMGHSLKQRTFDGLPNPLQILVTTRQVGYKVYSSRGASVHEQFSQAQYLHGQNGRRSLKIYDVHGHAGNLFQLTPKSEKLNRGWPRAEERYNIDIRIRPRGPRRSRSKDPQRIQAPTPFERLDDAID